MKGRRKVALLGGDPKFREARGRVARLCCDSLFQSWTWFYRWWDLEKAIICG